VNCCPPRRLRRRHRCHGIGILSVGRVVVSAPAGDEIRDEVGMRVHPRVKHGDGHRGTRRDIPCGRRADLGEMPLAGEQRIVDRRGRRDVRIKLRELDVRMCVELRRSRRFRRARRKLHDVRVQPTQLALRCSAVRRKRRCESRLGDAGARLDEHSSRYETLGDRRAGRDHNTQGDCEDARERCE
jgi:hypothetical protein